MEVFAQGAVVGLGEDGVLRVLQVAGLRNADAQGAEELGGVALISAGGDEGGVRHEGGDAFVEELLLVLGEEEQFRIDGGDDEGDLVVSADAQQFGEIVFGGDAGDAEAMIGDVPGGRHGGVEVCSVDLGIGVALLQLALKDVDQRDAFAG